MEQKEIIRIVIDDINRTAGEERLKLSGTLVYLDNEIILNIDGHNLGFNLYMITSNAAGSRIFE